MTATGICKNYTMNLICSLYMALLGVVNEDEISGTCTQRYEKSTQYFKGRYH